METLLSVAETLGISGVTKSHAKDKMTKVISAYVLEHPEEILYRSTEPIVVRIDTEALNNITIPDLPSGCINEFSTDREVTNYFYGVLTIEGEDKEHTPFVVSLI